MTKEEKAIRDFCGHHADWWPSITQVQEMLALAQPEQEPTYTSTQATNCAGCGEHKHTPLRIDAMGGYVCLTCIDKKLGSLLGEFGYEQPEHEPVECMCGICKLGHQRKPLTDEMVVSAARVLNERQADACGVDRDDQWAIYSDDFKADALAMLKAAHNIKEKNT